MGKILQDNVQYLRHDLYISTHKKKLILKKKAKSYLNHVNFGSSTKEILPMWIYLKEHFPNIQIYRTSKHIHILTYILKITENFPHFLYPVRTVWLFFLFGRWYFWICGIWSNGSWGACVQICCEHDQQKQNLIAQYHPNLWHPEDKSLWQFWSVQERWCIDIYRYGFCNSNF